MRLNKYIASCGYCSRRKADELIENGKVFVNDLLVTELGFKVSIEKDSVRVEGNILRLEEKKLYLALNKPKGYVTTSSDELGRNSVLDLVHEDIRVFSVGRLDMDTEGLLILTNDGEFANELAHPRNKVYKTYIAKTDYDISDSEIETLRKGVDIGGYITAPAMVRKLKRNLTEVKIAEGKNRQVRKMFEAINKKVIKLKRIAIGGLTLEDIKLGSYKSYTLDEIKKKIYS